jgi:hypothetical protein
MNATAAPPEPQSFADLKGRVLDEVIRQFRATRNDILRYGVWNARNLSDEEFNRTDDRKFLGYFRQDLLETRFVDRGIRVDIIQLWNWFDDQMSGLLPLSIAGEEIYILIQDKDLEKLRKRISELESFMPMLKSGDLDAFTRIKYKIRRTVLRLTYDIHHLNKRLDKYRKSVGFVPRHDEAPHDEPHPPAGADDADHTEGHDEAGS